MAVTTSPPRSKWRPNSPTPASTSSSSPIPPNHLTGLQELKKQGALPIILDEGVVNSAELEEYIKLEMLDGVAMKPARTAGLFDAKKQVEMLERNHLLFLGSGLTDPDIALAAALQLYAAYGLKYPAALNGPQFLDGTYLKRPIVVKNGAAEVPRVPDSASRWTMAALARPLRAAQVAVPSAFAFEDVGGTGIRLTHAGKPVFVYNYGMMLPPGVPERYRRSSYLHPLWAPNGAILTDDFPKDHYHHRGLSWMWPHVIVDGKDYDQWIVRRSAHPLPALGGARSGCWLRAPRRGERLVRRRPPGAA